MTPDEAQRRFRDLDSRRRAGRLEPAEFATAVAQLRLQDPAGLWWQIDPATGSWLTWTGADWAPPPGVAPATCPRCTSAVEPGDLFCGVCGQTLASTAAQPAAAKPASPPAAAPKRRHSLAWYLLGVPVLAAFYLVYSALLGAGLSEVVATPIAAMVLGFDDIRQSPVKLLRPPVTIKTPDKTPSTPVPAKGSAAATPVPPTRAPARPASGGAELYQDSFDAPERGRLPRESPEPATYTLGYDRGEYLIRITNPQQRPMVAITAPVTPGHAILSLDARLVGDTSGRYLILACRSTSTSQGVEFRLTVDPITGQYAFSIWEAGRETRAIDWRRSPAIRQGAQMNRLSLSCAGDQITGSINNSRVAIAIEAPNEPRQLSFGVGVLATAPLGPVEARFDNLVVNQELAAAEPYRAPASSRA